MIMLHGKIRFVWTCDKTHCTIVELYPAGIIRNVAKRKKRERTRSRVVKRGRRDCDVRSLQPIRLEIPLILINRMSNTIFNLLMTGLTRDWAKRGNTFYRNNSVTWRFQFVQKIYWKVARIVNVFSSLNYHINFNFNVNNLILIIFLHVLHIFN